MHQQLNSRLPNSGLAYLELTDIHRKWNDLEAAREFAATALDLGKQWHIRDTIQVARKQQRGHPDQAHTPRHAPNHGS